MKTADSSVDRRAVRRPAGSGGSLGGARIPRAWQWLLGLAGLTAALAATAAPAAAQDCPNAAVRADQGAQYLPDCRAYELVSPADKDGNLVKAPGELSDDEDRIMWDAQWLPGAPANSGPAGQTNVYAGQRQDGDGWTTRQMMPPPQFTASSAFDWSQDLTKSVGVAATIEQVVRAQGAIYLLGLDGSLLPRSPLLEPVAMQPRILPDDLWLYRGASHDGSHVVFVKGGVSLAPGTPLPGTTQTLLYEAVTPADGDPFVRLVNQDTSGAPIGGVCGASLGGTGGAGATTGTGSARHAISADGRTIFFGARPGAPDTGRSSCRTPGQRIFARRDGSETIQVSQSQCARTTPACTATDSDDLFEGASADGSRVFFSTTRQLVDSDLDTERDLYLYDFSAPSGESKLVQVSRGTDETGATNGNGANVLGVTRISEDGSRVYFVATGALTTMANGASQTAVTGANNLYVFQRNKVDHTDESIRFIAALAPTDNMFLSAWSTARISGLAPDSRTAWAVPMNGPTPDGHILVFRSAAPLAGAPGGYQNIFRYDDTTGELLRVSVGDDDHHSDIGTLAGQGAYMSPTRGRTVSEDGDTIVFTTDGRLDDHDSNDAVDAYRWSHGRGVALVSDDSTADGADSVIVSASGNSIAFRTSAPLVGEDVDLSPDVYVARSGGGFPSQPPLPTACDVLAGGCQGAGIGMPTVAQIASDKISGAGNASPGVRKRLRVGSISRKARRRAARRGVLRVRIRTNRAGVVRVLARAKLGKRTRRVAGQKVRARKAGAIMVNLRLSRAAKHRLRRGRALRVTLRVASPGARTRTATVRLNGARRS